MMIFMQNSDDDDDDAETEYVSQCSITGLAILPSPFKPDQSQSKLYMVYNIKYMV